MIYNPDKRDRSSGRHPRHFIASIVAALLAVALMITVPDARAAVSERPDPTFGANGRVLAILRVGDRVYIGGKFTAAVTPSGSSVPRRNLFAISATTGALDPTFRPEPDDEVQALAISPDGSMLYVGGKYRNIGGASRRFVGAVHPATGATVTGFRADANAKVLALAVGNGRLYMGGAFSTVNDGSQIHSREQLVAVDAGTGRVDPGWNAHVGPDEDPVRTIALTTDGQRLMVGGDFNTIDGRARKHLAAVGAVNGALDTTFAPETMPVVFGLTVDATRVFVALGGSGGEVRALDIRTAARKWFVHGNGNFQSVAVLGDLVYVAGHFGGANGFGGFERNRLAAVDLDTGRVDAFAPRVDSPLGVFEVQASAPHVYIGGDFSSVSGVNQPRFAQLTDR